jgi:hypothetical protein
MTLRVYRTTGYLTRSILQAELVREFPTNNCPKNPRAFADKYDGDLIETASQNPEEEEKNV